MVVCRHLFSLLNKGNVGQRSDNAELYTAVSKIETGHLAYSLNLGYADCAGHFINDARHFGSEQV